MEKQPLPDSKIIKTFGILSILFFCGIGLIFGVIAIIMSYKANKLYLERPEKYFIGQKNTGKILAIIGIILNIFVILLFLIFLGVIFKTGEAVLEVLPKGDFM